MQGTPEEIEASFKGCISYYGSYELDIEGGFVVHKVEGFSISELGRRRSEAVFQYLG